METDTYSKTECNTALKPRRLSNELTTDSRMPSEQLPEPVPQKSDLEKPKTDNPPPPDDTEPSEKRPKMANTVVLLALNLAPNLPQSQPAKSESTGPPSIMFPQTSTQFHRIRTEVNPFGDQERRLYEEREYTFKQTIKSLEGRLAEALKTHASSQSRHTLEKIDLHKRIKLLTKSDKLRERLRTAELKEANMKIKRLEAEKESLQNEVKLTNKIILNLRETLGEEGLQDMHNVEEEEIDIKHEVVDLRYKDEYKDEYVEPSLDLMTPEVLVDERPPEEMPCFADCSESYGIPGIKEEFKPFSDNPSELPIWVGKLYVFASDPKFFEITYGVHYKSTGRKNTFRCVECGYFGLGRPRMEDHIWINHWGGQFQCPECRVPIRGFGRYGMKNHVRLCHNYEIDCTEEMDFKSE